MALAERATVQGCDGQASVTPFEALQAHPVHPPIDDDAAVFAAAVGIADDDGEEVRLAARFVITVAAYAG